jgi:hypothetical protein
MGGSCGPNGAVGLYSWNSSSIPGRAILGSSFNLSAQIKLNERLPLQPLGEALGWRCGHCPSSDLPAQIRLATIFRRTALLLQVTWMIADGEKYNDHRASRRHDGRHWINKKFIENAHKKTSNMRTPVPRKRSCRRGIRELIARYFAPG